MAHAGSRIGIKPFAILRGREKRFENSTTKHRGTDDTTCALISSQVRDGAVLRPASGTQSQMVFRIIRMMCEKDLLTNITWRPHGCYSTIDLCHISNSQIICCRNPRFLQHSKTALPLVSLTTRTITYFLLFSTTHRQTQGLSSNATARTQTL
jgi:hypothetical protein